MELWHALDRASSIGSMFAWISMKLFGVVLSVPVIARAVIHCILVRLHRKVTDLHCLDCPSFLLGWVYHASML